MPVYTAVLSPGTDIFRIKSKKMTNITWESLYYKQGLIFFENLDAAKIFITQIDLGLKEITLNRTEDYIE